MKILDTKIPEVKIIEPDVFGDHRGWFMETWSLPKYEALHFNSMQDNESFTAKRGTLRGIHFQQDPMAQAKIVRVVRGAVLDVAVDLRKGSPTYLQWVSVELSAENKRQFYIPRGFGHGFVTLTDDVDFCYKADNLYDSYLTLVLLEHKVHSNYIHNYTYIFSFHSVDFKISYAKMSTVVNKF